LADAGHTPRTGSGIEHQGPSDTAKETGRLILKYAANDGHDAVRIWCYRARLEDGAPGWYVPLDDKKGGEADPGAVNAGSAKTGAGTDPLADRLFAEATELARKGWPVFPVKSNKEPLTKHGLLDATRDLNRIRAWWIQWPDANVAVRTGEHLLIIDVDDLSSFHALQARLGELPPTRTVRTPRGGLHFWFQVPPKIDFRCSAGVLASGVDIRGSGGYAVCPPSIGSYEKNEKLITGSWMSENDDEPALLPEEWRQAILALKPRGRVNGASSPIPEGQRNTELTSLAGSMRRRGMSQASIEAALLSENQERCRPMLADGEVKKIAASISRYAPALCFGEDAANDKPSIPPNLPDEFWNSSDQLRAIRLYSHYRYASADAVFGNLLSRIAAYLPNTTRVRTIVNENTSLNFMTAVVGESESGKTLAGGVAKEIFAGDRVLGAIEHCIGSGQGVCEAYMGTIEIPPKHGEKKPEKKRIQVRHNALVMADEGTQILGILARAEEILGAVLCSAFVGEQFGTKNASDMTTRHVTNYCFGLRVNFQPNIIAPLLAQAGIGLPSRFLYLSATDPAAEERCGMFAERPKIEIMKGVKQMHCAKSINEEARERRKNSLCGKLISEPLEKHYLLMLYKVAALLCYIEGRDSVTENDWARSKIVWRTSCEVRDFALHSSQLEQDARLAEQVGISIARQAGISEGEEKIERIVSRIAKYLAEHPGAGDRDIRRNCINNRRGEMPLFSAAMVKARGRLG
jgi:hypothetical protein